jgi:hypothetical protein
MQRSINTRFLDFVKAAPLLTIDTDKSIKAKIINALWKIIDQ